MSDSLKPAISNWVWLADLPNMKDALVVGDYPAHVRVGLEQHFANIANHPLTTTGDTMFTCDPSSLDCVVFDQAVGESLLSGSMPGGLQVLGQVKRALRSGGCAFFPVAHLDRRRPSVLARPLRRAGFGDVRPMYVYESLERPDTVIPAGRRTTAFFESWAWGGLRGKLRAALALTGAHHLTQPSMFFLAYP